MRSLPTPEDRKREYLPLVERMRECFCDRLKAMVLFGSRARGNARENSDHDILIVVDGLPKEVLSRNRVVREPLLAILDELPGAIAFVAKTPEEVDRNLTPLLLDVCAEGLPLYGEPYFEPYRRRALEAVRQSGLRRVRLGGTLMWVFPVGPKDDWELSWDGYRERA